MAISQETLSIEGFAGFKSAKLILRPFTVLIGPQSSGKSIAAKLLHYFRLLPQILVTSAVRDDPWQDFRARCHDRFLSYFPPEAWGRKPFELSLTTRQGAFRVKSTKGNGSPITLELPQFYFEEFDALKTALRGTDGHSARPQADFIRRARQHFGPAFTWQSRLIPAGRAFFAHLEDVIFSVSAQSGLDPLLAEFGQHYHNVRRELPQAKTSRRKPSAADALFASILKGTHRREEKRDYIDLPDGRCVPLRVSSSGQQESLPLLLFLQDIIASRTPGIPESLSIEEPEAHLFPDSQCAIVQLIAWAFNASKELKQVVVTTHSPYILGAVNLLLQAGSIYPKKSKLKKAEGRVLSETVPEGFDLKPGHVAAWLIADGTCRDLIAEDTGLIDENPVDAALSALLAASDRLRPLED